MVSNSLMAAAGLLLISTLSPGPNNLVVLRAAAHGGLQAAGPAIAGIVLGGLAMLGLVLAGLGSTFSHSSSLRTVVATGGAGYLAWLGIGLMRAHAGNEDRTALPAGLAGLFGFRFLNPKSWVMVLSIVAAFPPVGLATTLAWLAPAFVLIPTASLLLWASAGQRLAVHFQHPTTRRRIDCAMGVALLACAILLLL